MQSGTNDNGCCREAKRANLFYLQQDFQAEIPVYSNLRANFYFGEWATTETNISLKVEQEDQQNAMHISLYKWQQQESLKTLQRQLFFGEERSLVKKN
jgi:hypothetical protein